MRTTLAKTEQRFWYRHLGRTAGIALLSLFIVGCGSNAGEGEPERTDPRPTVSDRWTVDVVAYSRGWQREAVPPGQWVQKVEGRYRVEIVAVDQREAWGEECVQLEFVPGDGAPDRLRRRLYRLWVSREDLQLKTLVIVPGDPGPFDPWLESAGDLSFVVQPPRGVPLDLIDRRDRPEEASMIGGVSTIVRSRTDRDGRVVRNEYVEADKRVIELTVERAHTVTLTRQRWPAEGNWWTHFERYIDGHKDLEATLVVSDKER